MIPEQVKDYWKNQAKKYGASHDASWTDTHMMNLEYKTILKYLHDNQKVLDVGCANGYTTRKFAASKNINIHGIDYVSEMIEIANQMAIPKTSFSVGDITSLNLQEEYDVVIGIRVLINLNNWEVQIRAMNQCLNALKSGGLYLMSEATVTGWERLNLLRIESGLPEIPVPEFNVYLNENKVIEALKDRAKLVIIENFSSTYFVGTRIFKPLLCDPDMAANPNTAWNEFFASLPSYGYCGIQKLFVWEKK